MSDLYGSLFEGLEPERYRSKSEGFDPLFLEAGMALEEGLDQSLKDRFKAHRPGEFVTEQGIIFTPDFLVFNGAHRVGEIKLTWMASSDVPREPASAFPSKFDKYICQMKCYCHALETPYARLITFFVNGPGSWAKKFGPEMLAWDITFTARELHDNWTMVTNNAKHVGIL
jgi:hypothetical protein